MSLAERKDGLETKDPVYRIEPGIELFLGPSPDSDHVIVGDAGIAVILLPILEQTARGAVAVRYFEDDKKPPRVLFLPLPENIWPEAVPKAIARLNVLKDPRKSPTVHQIGNIFSTLQNACNDIALSSNDASNYVRMIRDLGEQTNRLLLEGY